MAEPEDLEAEFLREYQDPKLSPYPNLFVHCGTDETAFLRPSFISTRSLIDSYFAAARQLLEVGAGLVEPAVDGIIPPVLFLFRHAVELSLKHVIASLGSHIQARKPSYTYTVPEHHKLGALLGHAKGGYADAAPYLKQMGKFPFMTDQALRFIAELDGVDPEGEAFRYALKKKARKDPGSAARAKPLSVDVPVGLDALQAGIIHVERQITRFMDLVDISTDLYLQGEADMDPGVDWE